LFKKEALLFAEGFTLKLVRGENQGDCDFLTLFLFEQISGV